LGWACVHVPRFERLVTGRERVLYRDGGFDGEEMSAALVTQADVIESARKQLGIATLDGVEYAVLERNGEISLIRKSVP
jgi:uncharacterized membrane protein YcaP (DUF421 family)